MDRVADAEFVAFDLETTGLSPALDRIIEVGAVRFGADGVVTATFESLVGACRPSGAVARSIHQIDDEALAGAAGPEVVLPEFLSFLGDPGRTTLVAHHAAFDAGMLGRELVRAGLPIPGHRVVDTLAWSRRVWPDSGSHKLGALAGRLGGEEPRSHRALADSRQVRTVFLALAAVERPPDDPSPLAYPIHDGAGPCPCPWGWGDMAEAIDAGLPVQIEYRGGTRGDGPREVTPRHFVHRGGVAYLVAWCHPGRKVKEFQVERIRRFSIVAGDRSPAASPPGAAGRRDVPGR